MRMQAREEAIRAVEDAIRAPVAETPLLGSHFEPEHEDEEPQAKVPPITPAHEQGSVPPPPNAFSEAEALRWPAIREALSAETRSRVGQGLAVRVVRGYAAASDTPKGARLCSRSPNKSRSAKRSDMARLSIKESAGCHVSTIKT